MTATNSNMPDGRNQKPGMDTGTKVRLAGGGILVVLFLIFAFSNTDDVPVDYLFGEGEWPLVVVMLVCFVLGAVVDRLAVFMRRRKRRQARRDG